MDDLYSALMGKAQGNVDPSAGGPRASATTYNTPLNSMDEMAFRDWVAKNKVPFNPNGGSADYDMRGFYSALMAGNPRAASAIDPNDSRMHYPDYWKTPAHETFSVQSQWANQGAPDWNASDQLVSPNGRILFDDRARPESMNMMDRLMSGR